MIKKTGVLLAAMLTSQVVAADQMETFKRQYCDALKSMVIASVGYRYDDWPLEDALEGVDNTLAQRFIIQVYQGDLPKDEPGMESLYKSLTDQVQTACWREVEERYP